MRAAIVLAAGLSRRFGHADKLFAPVRSQPLLLHVLRAARAAPVRRVILVGGINVWRLRRLVRSSGLAGIQVVRVRGRIVPLRASLARAAAMLRSVDRQAFVYLGDMPGHDLALPRKMAGMLRVGVDAVRPRHEAVPGHPVLVRTSVLKASVRNGRGSAPVASGWRMRWIEAGPDCIADIDSQPDLARFRRRSRFRSVPASRRSLSQPG